MKLFTKYSRINIVAVLIIFIVACAAFYFSLRLVVIRQVDQDLEIEEKEILTYVAEHDRLPENISVSDQQINYKRSTSGINRHFNTAQMRDTGDKQSEKYRQLSFSTKAAGQWYEVRVSKSLEETETLTRSILLIAFVTILLILLTSFIINRVVLKRIWKPFYQSLDTANRFKIGKGEQLQLAPSEINEFQLMNETIQKVMERAQLDYIALKTFSENASHEIQTPLAVIRSKLDLLAQDEHLTQKQSESLQATYQSVQKLSGLNQSLLLLAKIENNQFEEIRTVDLKKKLEEKLSEFHELWLAQDLTVQSCLDQTSITINEELLDNLLNNLLSNATKHNYLGGKITTALKKNGLSISNTSHAKALDSATLYQRFSKSTNSSSNGLGLSIIKQICEYSGFETKYEYAGGMHVFMVSWKN